jgi:hypothetical protein
MPHTAEYYFSRAEEIEGESERSSDPILRRAMKDVAQSMRAMAELIHKTNGHRAPG